MKAARRIISLALLAAVTILRLWLCVLGWALLVGNVAAVAITAALLLLRMLLPLRIALLVGAVAVLHWSYLLAVVLAAPRLLLMLPGLIAALLARWRHPRARWRAPQPA
ncbi:MAG TPA: hypothetical protein VGF89_14290 [Steroidobacteraceae bacterium]|jgi:hypothetical protein